MSLFSEFLDQLRTLYRVRSYGRILHADVSHHLVCSFRCYIIQNNRTFNSKTLNVGLTCSINLYKMSNLQENSQFDFETIAEIIFVQI